MSQDTAMSPNKASRGEAKSASEEAIAQPSPTYVRVLLITVIGLGVLMVGGAAVVIGTVIKRVSNPEAVPSKPGFGETEISIPADSQVIGVDNGDTRIIVKLQDAEGPLLLLLDPRKGEEKGRIRLRPQAQ
ncbi:MAG: hypothetical protein HOK33_01095 [Rhodobiaceae bacterium]|jgi:hypothetical protein|nr:hypothetical protein [Rhodobiaceae bacterium]MBT5517520.1 hypothetical protein [Rhodobiaceae bacterium]MBT7279910.1 hypothetical protein [Rhodobiaceae bacterium]MDG2496501.1 DUF6476 family protein [Alphaproteobacteria bacterium]